MKLPVSVEIAPSGTTAENVTQEVFIVRRDLKTGLLLKLLHQYHGSVLLFTRTKIGARKISRDLRKHGQNAAEIHSDRSLNQRKEALDGFKSGRYRVLVATDIAARGIDVTGIELVINYDVPDESENYIHRIGRTARAGREGRAITLATPEQGTEVREIEKLLKKNIPVSRHPEFPEETFSAAAAHAPQKHGRGPRKGGGQWRGHGGGGHGGGHGGHGGGKGNLRRTR
jgi:ATP-dependent RNA helicase RhlE